MERVDSRKLSTREQQQNRYIGVELRKRGKGCVETARILGVNPSSVSRWYKKYEEEGMEALVIKKRGAEPGSKSKLNPNRTNVLKKVLVKYTPDDLELGFSLWTRQAIQSLLSKV